MKTEIECRLLDVDVEEFLRKLETLKADFKGDWIQLRYCYDFNPVKENSWIRLRKNEKETTLTIKEINSSKIDGTKECEIVVSDFDTTDEMLNKLGYVARSKQENRRIRYYIDDVEVDIDFWPYIPTYVEFEGKDEESIKRLCKKLDIDYSNLVSMDVSSIYDYYGKSLSTLPQILLLEDDRKNKKYNINNHVNKGNR